MEKRKTYPTVTLRPPLSVVDYKAYLDRVAAKQGMSRNQLILSAISHYIGYEPPRTA